MIYLLQGFYILSGLFEINWFCFGLEKFKLTTMRSTAVRLVILVCVFVFVRSPGDLGKYVLILSISSILSVLAVHAMHVQTQGTGTRQTFHVLLRFLAGKNQIFLTGL